MYNFQTNSNVIKNMHLRHFKFLCISVCVRPLVLKLCLQAMRLNKLKILLQSVGQRYDCPGPWHDPTLPGVGITSSQPPLPPYKQPAAAFFGTCSGLTQATA